MRREAFGAVAAVLPEPDLAKVLLMAGIQKSGLLACLLGRVKEDEWIKQARDALSRLPTDPYSKAAYLRLDLQAVRPLIRTVGDSPADMQRLRDTVPAQWHAFFSHSPSLFRVSLARPYRLLDLQWLAHVLTAAQIGVDSVVNESTPGADLFWEWPLRIGVPATRAGDRLLELLAKGPYRDLYDARQVSDEATQFDLFLFPDSLKEARRLCLPPDFRASTLLVLGGAETDLASTTLALRSHLKQRDRAGLAALCFVPAEERLAWLMALVRELSHNATLDTALFRARLTEGRRNEPGHAGIGDLQPPLVFSSEPFLRGARIAETAWRIGTAMQAHEQADTMIPIEPRFANPDAPPERLRTSLGDSGPPAIPGLTVRAIGEVGSQIVHDLPSYIWDSERGDATALARVRRQVEAHAGVIHVAPIAVPVSAMGVATPKPPQTRVAELRSFSRTVPRAIDFDLLPNVDADASCDEYLPPDFAAAESPEESAVPIASPMELAVSEAPVEKRHVQCRITQGEETASIKRLQPNQTYRALIHIGVPRDPTMIVARSPLDERRLPPSEHGHNLDIVFCPLHAGMTPLMRRVHLPKHGDGDTATFDFSSGAESERFRARVIVLHRNRILETLLLHTPAPGQDLTLDPENLVTPHLAASEVEGAADLAIVINDNPQGVPGITTIAGDTASFIEPTGLAQSINTVKKLLSAMNVSAVGAATRLDDPAMVSLMIDLANHGAAILREIRTQLPIAPYQAATRVQVVEAVTHAYLPVEFLYSGKAPAPGAKLCPNAATALASGDPEVHRNCEHAKGRDHVCPAAFWGFSKCIERQPFGLSAAHVFSVPQPGSDAIAPFQTAVVAASKRVDAADLTGPAGLETNLKILASRLRSAQSWDDWHRKVQDTPAPTLLVLLPHSANSPGVTDMPALEIANSWLESSSLDEDYVHPEGSDGPGPLVLLLGCSTALTDIAFLNFVREFKRSGASIVLGTLATIHGKQAAAFANRLLGQMKAQGNGRPFDQTLLRVKQELLAAGEPFVLSLAAYGHSSWHIET